MNIFHRFVFLFAALGALVCSCGGRRVAEAAGDAGEPAFLEIFERPEGGWTAVSVSPFDGSRDTLVIDRPLSRLIVMSTSHYGFLDALGATDRIVGISGPDYLYSALVGSRQALAASAGLAASETSSGGSTASLRSAPPLASLRSAPVPPLTVPRVAWVSPSRLVSAALASDLAAGLASPDRGRPRHARGRGPDRRRGGENLFSQTLREMGGASQSEESGLSEPAARSQSAVIDRRQPTSALADVGYDAAPDYEKIVALRPEVVLTYAVSGAKSPFESKLEQLGIKVFTVNEHLERHPLARAAYIRLFGALTGQMAAADSALNAVKENYNTIAKDIANRHVPPRKVLLNIPYNDQWFVPSTDNYLSAMISDAGGIVLGSESGKSASSVMSVEKAYSLSKEADCWLNVGWCHTREDLLGVNPIFKDMLGNIEGNALELGYGSFPVVWNDNKRVNPKGGNDIWQSGVARPDLVLQDLATILHPDNQGEAGETLYYRQIN